MINAITYENIIKYLGEFLDTYSGLAPSRILNADSIRGTDLGELINDHEQYSPEVSSSFLLFELVEDQDGENYLTKGEVETTMMTIQSYNFHIMIYGNTAPTDAQKISSLFKQESDALSLRDLGIFIKGVSPIEAINEFINNTLLLRRDIIVHLQVRYQFEGIGEEVGDFNSKQNITIVVKGVQGEN